MSGFKFRTIEEHDLMHALHNYKVNCSITNEELKILLNHYTQLEAALKLHGEVYHLVWMDVFLKLETFIRFYKARNEDRKLNFNIKGEKI